MSETKHTPGPWELTVPTGTAVTYICFRSAETHKLIGYVQSANSDEAEANGRLAIAAPALLEACQLFLRFHESDHEDRRNSDSIQATYDKALATARAAIAKAEGR